MVVTLRLIVLIGVLCLPLAAFAQDSTGPSSNDPVVAVDGERGARLSDLSGDDVQQAFRRMKRKSGDIQFDLRTETDIPPPPPGWLKAFGRFIEGLAKFLMPFFQVLFWLIVAGIGALVLYAIGSALWEAYQSRGRRSETETSAPEYRPSARQVRILLEDADALAADGKFDAAVHLLLFRSIQDIDAARPGTVRQSMTSREIAVNDQLGPKTREAFSAIAALVECSHFGTTQLLASDYQAARSVYLDFATHADLQAQRSKGEVLA